MLFKKYRTMSDCLHSMYGVPDLLSGAPSSERRKRSNKKTRFLFKIKIHTIDNVEVMLWCNIQKESEAKWLQNIYRFLSGWCAYNFSVFFCLKNLNLYLKLMWLYLFLPWFIYTQFCCIFCISQLLIWALETKIQDVRILVFHF